MADVGTNSAVLYRYFLNPCSTVYYWEKEGGSFRYFGDIFMTDIITRDRKSLRVSYIKLYPIMVKPALFDRHSLHPCMLYLYTAIITHLGNSFAYTAVNVSVRSDRVCAFPFYGNTGDKRTTVAVYTKGGNSWYPTLVALFR